MLGVTFFLAACGIALFGLYEVRMVLGFWKQRRTGNSMQKTEPVPGVAAVDIPRVLVQLPIYNEFEVVEQLILKVAELEYPSKALSVQILDDSDDETYAEVERVLAMLPAEIANCFSHIRRDSREGYKAGALAYGMKLEDSEFIAIFDADFLPPKNFLSQALLTGDAFKKAEVAFVQGRWTYYNCDTSFFAKVQSILIDRHFLVQKPYQNISGDDITFNGSAGVWRRSAIEAAGGWSGKTLCEDLDLTYRCVLLGNKGVYDFDLECPNEIPTSLEAFKLQQRRWAKGTAQNMVQLLPSIANYGSFRRRLNNVFAVSGYLVHPLLLVYSIVWPLLVLGGADTRFLWSCQIALILGNFAAISGFATTYFVRGTDTSILKAAVEVFLAMALGISLMVNNTVAFISGLFSKRGVFDRTPKTGRGVAMTSRNSGGGRLHWSIILEANLAIYGIIASTIMFARGFFMEAQQTLLFGLVFAGLVYLQLNSAARSYIQSRAVASVKLEQSQRN